MAYNYYSEVKKAVLDYLEENYKHTERNEIEADIDLICEASTGLSNGFYTNEAESCLANNLALALDIVKNTFVDENSEEVDDSIENVLNVYALDAQVRSYVFETSAFEEALNEFCGR